MKKSFEVMNVKCGGCANRVKEALKEEFGEVEVDVEQKSLTLEIEETQEEALKKKLKELGYPVVGDENGFFTKAKSFISCAIGKVQS